MNDKVKDICIYTKPYDYNTTHRMDIYFNIVATEPINASVVGTEGSDLKVKIVPTNGGDTYNTWLYIDNSSSIDPSIEGMKVRYSLSRFDLNEYQAKYDYLVSLFESGNYKIYIEDDGSM